MILRIGLIIGITVVLVIYAILLALMKAARDD